MDLIPAGYGWRMSLLAPPLAGFLVVARDGNLSRAARRLALSQPAVTKQMQALERALGVPLLERAGRGVRLTQAGEILRGYAERGAALLDECRAVIAEVAAGRAGRLTLGAGVTTSVLHLPAWLERFRKERPAVELVIHTGDSRTVEDWVRRREVDAGFVTSEPRDPDLVVTGVLEEEIVLVVARRSSLRGRVDAARVPLICFPRGTGFRAYLDARLEAADRRPVARMESDSVEAIKAFVRADLGAAYLPESAVRRELRAGWLRRVTMAGMPPLRRRTSLIRRSDRRPGPALRHFVEVVRGR
jgi:DNA-binding transcriptional LysR family regulator